MPAPLARAGLPAAALALLLAACGGDDGARPCEIAPAPACDDGNPCTADACDPATGCTHAPVTGGLCGGDGSGLRLFAPSDFEAGLLRVDVPALAAGERLALILVNAEGVDYATPTIQVSGTGPAPAPRLEPALLARLAGLDPAAGGRDEEAAERDARAAVHDLVRARGDAAERAWIEAGRPRPAAARMAMAAASAVGETRSFCHGVYDGTTLLPQRRDATLRHVTAEAEFWVTDEAWSGFAQAVGGDAGAFLAALGETYAGGVLPALGTYFGPESDVDANGKMRFLFADLGPAFSGGFVVGYFDRPDVVYSLDTTPGCTGTGSNQADLLYLTDPATWLQNSASATATSLRDESYPGVMAHELQHNVSFNVRCLQRACNPSPGEETWLNEGLSMVSEDVAGYGLNTPTGRTAAGRYLSGWSGGSYQDFSLTIWEASALGNYEGVHLFSRYWLDQVGPAYTWDLVHGTASGKANFEAAAGVTFEEGLARFALASTFSGEPYSPLPAWDFASGTAWSPLHTALKPVAYTPLPMAGATQLRRDGWALFETGPGSGGPASITVVAPSTPAPYALVVRFSGALP